MQARNECLKCGHRWTDKPMGFASHLSCPKCGSVYWKWIDYEKPKPG